MTKNKLTLFSNSLKKLKNCSTSFSLKVSSDGGDFPRTMDIALSIIAKIYYFPCFSRYLLLLVGYLYLCMYVYFLSSMVILLTLWHSNTLKIFIPWIPKNWNFQCFGKNVYFSLYRILRDFTSVFVLCMYIIDCSHTVQPAASKLWNNIPHLII